MAEPKRSKRDHGWRDEYDYGYAPVDSDTVIGATTVNVFERHVLPNATDEYRDISHLDEGLAGFFGRTGRSSNRDD
jgi:hypothetical protein